MRVLFRGQNISCLLCCGAQTLCASMKSSRAYNDSYKGYHFYYCNEFKDVIYYFLNQTCYPDCISNGKI